MSHLSDYLAYYVTLEAPGYAVLVSGAWGIGKTYQVKACIPQDERLYVSLFGVQSIEQLHAEVFAASDPTFSKVKQIVQRGSENVADMGGVWALAGAIPGVFNAAFRQRVEPTKTLIFDDLERSELKIKDILGAINSYVEHLGFRVIVIAHDQKLTKKLNPIKEKIFGQSIRVKAQVSEAMSHFVQSIDDDKALKFVDTARSNILDTFFHSNEQSLRVLRYAVQDLVRLHSALTDNHIKNEAAMEELVKTFVAFQIEVRSGNLDRDHLQNRRGTESRYWIRASSNKTLEKPPLLIANEKYPTVDLESTILSDNVLSDMLIEGLFLDTEIQQALDNSAYFIVPEDVPPWKTVTHFDQLDDAVVDLAVERMNAQFDGREVTDSGEMLHIFSLRLMMAENGIIGGSLDEVTDENMRYVDDLLAAGNLPPREPDWRWYSDFQHSHDGLGYWGAQTNADHFNKIWKHLLDAREEAFQRTVPDILESLLDDLSKNSNDFFEKVSPTNSGSNPYAYIPLLHHCSASRFVDVWLASSKQNWRYVNYALENRYESGQLERDLSAEKEWALSILDELNRRADAEEGFKALRIRRVRPKVLMELAQTNSLGEIANEA
ncbi:hypothetical protein [Yoonia sp. 2307UL14-13]|uniref:hypothetical protein n=1 Tax=Yoonia sp. 2307UL14-13 TaxID=3126506 RepID=UPI0030AF60EC